MSSTLVYVTVPADQPLGVNVSSIEGRHSLVYPGQSIAYPVTDAQGLSVCLMTDEAEEQHILKLKNNTS